MWAPAWAQQEFSRLCFEQFDLRLTTLSDTQRRAAESDSESLFHLDFLLARLRARGNTVPERMRVVWKKRSWEVERRKYSYYQALLETEGLPKPSRFDPAGLTTAHFEATLEMKRWCATVSPHGRDGWFAAGCRDLGSNLDWWEANWSTRAYLEPLLDSYTLRRAKIELRHETSLLTCLRG